MTDSTTPTKCFDPDLLESLVVRTTGMLAFVRFAFRRCSDLQEPLEIHQRDVSGLVGLLEVIEETLALAQAEARKVVTTPAA